MNLLRKNDIAIYCSKSSKVEISIEEQLTHLKKYCKHFDLDIVKEYIDTDNVNKPMFKQMVEDIKTKSFNIVLSYSFDTLSKNEEDIYNLVNELYKYKYELQLESSYKYKAITKPLFKLDRKDTINQEEPPKEKKEKAKCYPMFDTHKVKNPISDEPYNWVELLDEDTSWFEDDPIFDNEGNYLGTSKNVYVIFKELRGFGRIKLSEEEKKKKEEIEKNQLKPKKLFDTYNDKVEREKQANGEKELEISNVL